ncbi:unnamed protein product [Trichogramma brassicae]|uniref:Reverse transcriptase domain-containing protein n=1 Tax=Trichogramma brassicae TaxID=86971 RepID=A0A6H5HZ69_9HYME|nr:unnamed protein product [Trichogramma brassicae]
MFAPRRRRSAREIYTRFARVCHPSSALKVAKNFIGANASPWIATKYLVVFERPGARKKVPKVSRGRGSRAPKRSTRRFARGAVCFTKEKLRLHTLRWPSRVMTQCDFLPSDMAESSCAAVRGVFCHRSVQAAIRWAETALSFHGRSLIDQEARGKYWASLLHQANDGKELAECTRVRASHSWVDRNSAALSGRDYVQFHHVRVNALPTRIRTSRGRRGVGGPPIECRAGCGTTETAAHVIQGCHRTHGGRILRHDAICRIAVSSLRQLDGSVRQEPHFHTREGLRKPDVVAVKDQVVRVFDAQVISASSSLDDSHRRKVAKYDTFDLRHQVASEYGVEADNIRFSSITISWRGIWSAASAASLCELGLSKCLDSITVRALRGSHMNWLRWNRMTTHISGYMGINSAGRREGIGNQPRIPNGRSTDRATPSTQTQQIDDNNNVEMFACRFPGCGLPWETTRGRGVHERAAHPDWTDRENLRAKRRVGPGQWQDDERRLLARREAELLHEAELNDNITSVKRNINVLLKPYTDRTLEALKSQRKRDEHKQLVMQMLQQLNLARLEPDVGEEDGNTSQLVLDAPILNSDLLSQEHLEYFSSLEPVGSNTYDLSRLNSITLKIKREQQALNRVELMDSLTLFLNDILPPKSKRNPEKQQATKNFISNKQRRRAEYARVQGLWKKDPSACVDRILTDQLGQDVPVPKEVMEPYWRAIMTQQVNSSLVLGANVDTQPVDVWKPITTSEIKIALPPARSAPGPDGLLVCQLKEIPLEVIARVLNVFMLLEDTPSHLKRSRTVLIPKEKGTNNPSKYRPITVSSVLLRTFHKILANRLKEVPLDPRQRAFTDTDGTTDNICLLDTALKYHHSRFKSLYLAMLDMQKAFDSVAQEALFKILTAKNISPRFITYYRQACQGSATRIQHGDWESEDIYPTCGVKQGDPLSPFVFNCVIDEMLKRSPTDIGVNLGGLRVDVMAFADDLNLLASTKSGLQQLIDYVVGFLGQCGLTPNTGKCSSLAIRGLSKEKKTAVDTSCRFKVGARTIASLKRTDTWRYLGVSFNGNGRVKLQSKESLTSLLGKITKAPLKPQQRLWALKVKITPKIMFPLVLGDARIGYLRSLDRVVRHAVRGWLHLPHDCPVAYFHAAVMDGGLGIPSFRWSAMLNRRGRLEHLRTSEYLTGDTVKQHLDRAISKTENFLKDDNNNTIMTRAMLCKYWAQQLYARFDGVGLRESGKVRGQHNWLSDGTRFLSGHDFIQSVRARINALPTKSRTTRGRAQERACRAGCGKVETLNHVVQQCFRSHNARISRHNALSKYVAKNLRKQGYLVEEEPRFQTTEGLRKPDICATKDETTLVLDMQVRGDTTDLDRANREKCQYYENNEDLKREIKKKYGSTATRTLAITLNWRGVWSKKSAEAALEDQPRSPVAAPWILGRARTAEL